MDPGAAGRRCQPPPPRPSSCTSTVVSSGSSKLGGFYPSISQWGGCMVGSPGGYTSHLYPRLPPYLRGLTTSWLLTTYSDSGNHNQKVLGAKNAGTEAYQASLGVEFPLRSLTSAYIYGWGFLRFRYLKCLVKINDGCWSYNLRWYLRIYQNILQHPKNEWLLGSDHPMTWKKKAEIVGPCLL